MRLHAPLVAAMAVLLLCACSKDDDGTGEVPDDDDASVPGEGGTPGNRDGGRDASWPIWDDDAGSEDDAGGAGDGGTPPVCPSPCGQGQRCEDSGGGAACRNVSCTELTCGALTECAPAAGGGNYCKSIACVNDLECLEGRFCEDGTRCVDDLCEANELTCASGNEVQQCASNGGAVEPRFACQGNAYFESKCTTDGAGGAGCTCQDDWDCPKNTACVAGACQGTGVAPTCTLEPARFEEVLPSVEFRWGGTSRASPAVNGPFPDYAQVSMTPVVANLDDDNGDGRINELDFPELVFVSYRAPEANIHFNGVVRAIHAGGTSQERGKDYFARCGAKHWREGDPLPTSACEDSDAVGRPGGGVAVGDLDDDGTPEIVATTENGTVLILDNQGALIAESEKALPSHTEGSSFRYPQPALANLDSAGLAEIIVGNRVLTLQKVAQKLAFLDLFTAQSGPALTNGSQGEFGPMVCVANLIASAASEPELQEIVAGTTLYRLEPPVGVTSRAGCAGGDASDFCAGRLKKVWSARERNGSVAIPNPDGFCAVANVLAADPTAAPGPGAPLDATPEVVVVANGRVLILRASDGQLLRSIDVEVGERGGAPNIDDFDGDGFPEIALASSGFYTVIDLQQADPTYCPAWTTSLPKVGAAPGSNNARNPGSCSQGATCNPGAVCIDDQCVCLHNGWKRITEDDSSKATSSSVFDFNGDGAAEVVYGDECYFRIYDGRSGNAYLALPSLSRTVLENPVVADVDNDGNAEIVIVNNSEKLQCGETQLAGFDDQGQPTTVSRESLPNGIQVYGDKSDTWVSARRIWNQHAYHVTNVIEGGQIPTREPESWRAYGERVYNTYRSQPRSYGVAPDLTLTAIQLSSPDAACGSLSNKLEIVLQVKNVGDLRVGPGVEIGYRGEFGGGAPEPLMVGGSPLRTVLTTSLEPGNSVLVRALYQVPDGTHTQLPSRIAARVDDGDAQRECRENNNEIAAAVDAGEQLADLKLEVLDTDNRCAGPAARVRLTNVGSVAASDVLVRLYAGDPSAGGQQIGQTIFGGPFLPNEPVELTIVAEPIGRVVRIWAVADPLDSIEECNNANNIASGPELRCGVVI